MYQTTRRTFIRQAACAALGSAGLLSTIFDLRRINAAALAGDYKALVCLFLYGGNDANNVLIPTDQSTYDEYAAGRNYLAVPLNSVLPLNVQSGGGGHTFGFHPSMPELQNLFNQGKLTMVANVGTLVAPINRMQYFKRTVEVPPQLFSHEDQSVQWQTSVPDKPGTKTGWGGRAADLVRSLNTNTQVSMALSIGGTNTFEFGNQVIPYLISQNGGSVLRGFGTTGNSAIRLQGFKQLLALPHARLMEQAYADTINRSIVQSELFTTAISNSTPLTTAFPNTDLGRQLNMVAKLIAARNDLGMRRQIFFCSVGGYDTHGDQLTSHADLLTELSQGMSAFYNATVELGVEPSVTTFTASDFGRTFTANNGGTDHGWGSHQFVMGGAVQGNQLYGTFPTLAVNGPDDTQDGRWIPTTSVDEFSATMAKWFGVSVSDMPLVFPNIGRFSNSDLGFLA